MLLMKPRFTKSLVVISMLRFTRTIVSILLVVVVLIMFMHMKSNPWFALHPFQPLSHSLLTHTPSWQDLKWCISSLILPSLRHVQLRTFLRVFQLILLLVWFLELRIRLFLIWRSLLLLLWITIHTLDRLLLISRNVLVQYWTFYVPMDPMLLRRVSKLRILQPSKQSYLLLPTLVRLVMKIGPMLFALLDQSMQLL